MIRDKSLYIPLAKFCSRLADMLFYFIETNKITFKAWNAQLHPKIEKSNDLGVICSEINSHFTEELQVQSKKVYSGQDYVRELTDRLPSEYHRKLMEYFSADDIVSQAEQYLGFRPDVKKFMVYANLPGNTDEVEVGSKAFHRDALCHRVFEIFFAVTPVTDKNGPFYFITNSELQDRQEVLITENMNKNDWYTSGRLSEQELQHALSVPLNIGKFDGEPGSYVALNTGITYHRGGFVSEGYRIVGRVIYGGEEYSNTKKLSRHKKLLLVALKRLEYSFGRYFRKIS